MDNSALMYLAIYLLITGLVVYTIMVYVRRLKLPYWDLAVVITILVFLAILWLFREFGGNL